MLQCHSEYQCLVALRYISTFHRKPILLLSIVQFPNSAHKLIQRFKITLKQILNELIRVIMMYSVLLMAAGNGRKTV